MKINVKVVFSISFFVILLLVQTTFSQNISSNSSSLNSKRLNEIIISESVVYVASVVFLHSAWYKKFSRFHFFNDMPEWLLMDKFGHATTTYNIGAFQTDLFRWAGMNNTKSIWWGAAVGSAYQLTIETMDGFSPQWGFSLGDFAANTLGSALYVSQALTWNEQRIQLKFSFHTTIYPQYRPEMLGKNLGQQWLKDYNGQTYWLSANIFSFLPSQAQTNFPNWVNVAFGYGAEGMLSGRPDFSNGADVPQMGRYRKFFFAPDIAWDRVNKNQSLVPLPMDVINFLKTPLPTLEFNKKRKIVFHPLYF